MIRKLLYRFKWWLKYRGKDPKDIKLHPTKNLQIEYKHTVDGIHYYQLLNDYDMPINRFRFVRTYYQQLELKFTSETLKAYMESIMENAETGKLSKVFEIANEVKYRSEWLFEPESLYKLYSVITFDLQENIDDYDIKYNAPKIESFKKKELLRVILRALMSESQDLLNLSDTDLQEYMLELQENLKRQEILTSVDTQ